MISYGICLGENYNKDIVQKLINSIDIQNYKELPYEIILVGNYKNDLTSSGNLHIIQFDETIKRGWITKKKNIIASEASYPTLCIIHDYYIFPHDWFEELLKYNSENPNWNVLMNSVSRYEGDRHSDWLVNQKYMDFILQKYPDLGEELMNVAPGENNGPRWVCALPYDEMGLKHIQYISGGYILTKTDVLRKNKFDERYGWGEAPEDIIWSENVINNGIRFDFNPYNSITLQKPGKWLVYQMTDRCVNLLKENFIDVQ